MNKCKNYFGRSRNNAPSGATPVYVHCSSYELALYQIQLCYTRAKRTTSSHEKVICSSYDIMI